MYAAALKKAGDRAAASTKKKAAGAGDATTGGGGSDSGGFDWLASEIRRAAERFEQESKKAAVASPGKEHGQPTKGGGEGVGRAVHFPETLDWWKLSGKFLRNFGNFKNGEIMIK